MYADDAPELCEVEYCGGRLVDEPVTADVTTHSDPGPRYAVTGRRWTLDGEEITAVEAAAFRIVWETDMFGRPLEEG